MSQNLDGKLMQKRSFWSHFNARAPTLRGLGDTKDVTMGEPGTSGVARGGSGALFFGPRWLFGGAGSAKGRRREVQGRQKRPKGAQK